MLSGTILSLTYMHLQWLQTSLVAAMMKVNLLLINEIFLFLNS